MAGFAPYPHYKDSGLPWIGRIPAHWETRRNRFLFREVDNRSAHGKEEHLSMSQVYGLVPSNSLSRKSLQSENYAGGKLVTANDLVLNRLKAHLGVFAIAKQAGVVSPDYTVLRPNDAANVHYCEFLFKTSEYVAEFRRRTKGIVEGFWRLYTDDFYNVHALFPPSPEQTQIANYLRTQDTKIARFIRIKRELIARLNEQKLRLIDHAVTGGLDTSGKRKPSGVDWLGDVPGHWEVLRLKFIARNITNQTTSKADDEIYLALEHVQSWTGIAQPPDGEIEFASTVKRFIPDDVLLGKLRPYLAKITRANCVGVCVSEFLVLRSNIKQIFPAYLEHLLRCKRVIDLINSSTEGAKMPRTDWDFIGNVQIPVPPLTEQHTILTHIKAKIEPLTAAIHQAEQEITLIREYRERLIADAVTGQIDLRGWQPRADDAICDDELAALAEDNNEYAEETNEAEENS